MRLLRSRLLFFIVLGAQATAYAQDFDPHGRRHPAVGEPHPGAQPPHRATPEETAERALRAALAEPGAPFPLDRLVRAFREKDGNLDGLVERLQERTTVAAASRDSFASAALHATLGGVFIALGRKPEALPLLRKASEESPRKESIARALAAALLSSGDSAGARTRYEALLALQTDSFARQETLRTLRGLYLDAGDVAGARRIQADLVRAAGPTGEVWAELARDLAARGRFDAADEEFTVAALAMAHGDRHALASLLREQGEVEWKRHSGTTAIATLRRALDLAAGNENLRTSIWTSLADVYRAERNLPELITLLASSRSPDRARLMLLASLYEETGESNKAIETYRRVIALSAAEVDARVRIIHILEGRGESEQAVAEYSSLTHASPSATYTFDLANLLFARGEKERALALLEGLERTNSRDDSVLSRLAELYKQKGEEARAERVLTVLANRGSGNGGYVVDLGDHLFASGDKEGAKKVWARILTTVHPPARAAAALADVYLEHELLDEAVKSYEDAVKLAPENGKFQFGLGTALVRGRKFSEAVTVLTEALRIAIREGDAALARQARAQLVTVWESENELPRQATALAGLFLRTPPDVESGRTLAEVQLRMGKPDAADATLKRLLDLAPSDAEAHLSRERILVSEGKFKEAIAVLEHLATADPARAPKLYERMSQYAKQTFQDEDALRFAERAVAVSPDDAEAHRRLAEAYAAHQKNDQAKAEFRKAIEKDDHLFTAYFALADLLDLTGEKDESERTLIRVIGLASEDDMVRKAAETVMRSATQDSFDHVEAELIPLSISNRGRPIFRHLLLGFYEQRTANDREAALASGEAGDKARAALARTAERGQKVLFEALYATDDRERDLALTLLSFSTNKRAAAPLLAFAKASADTTLRVRAMDACVALEDAGLFQDLADLVLPPASAPKPPRTYAGDAVIDSALYGIARLGTPVANRFLKRVVVEGSVGARAAALVALARAGDRSIEGLALSSLDDRTPTMLLRAAAFAAAELKLDGAAEKLIALTRHADSITQGILLAALVGLPHSNEATRANAAALFAEAMVWEAIPVDSDFHDGVSAIPYAELGAVGLTALAGGSGATSTPANKLVGNVPQSTAKALHELVARAAGGPRSRQGLKLFEHAVTEAWGVALRGGGEGADAVMAMLDEHQARVKHLFGEMGGAAGASIASNIVAEITPALLPYASDKDPTYRMRADAALRILGTSRNREAFSFIRATLLGDDRDQTEKALRSLATWPAAEDLAPITRSLASRVPWSARFAATEALARIGAEHPKSASALKAVALSDESSLVRDAALQALAALSHEAARDVAAKLVHTDSEPRIRDAANEILHQ